MSDKGNNSDSSKGSQENSFESIKSKEEQKQNSQSKLSIESGILSGISDSGISSKSEKDENSNEKSEEIDKSQKNVHEDEEVELKFSQLIPNVLKKENDSDNITNKNEENKTEERSDSKSNFSKESSKNSFNENNSVSEERENNANIITRTLNNSNFVATVKENQENDQNDQKENSNISEEKSNEISEEQSKDQEKESNKASNSSLSSSSDSDSSEKEEKKENNTNEDNEEKQNENAKEEQSKEGESSLSISQTQASVEKPAKNGEEPDYDQKYSTQNENLPQIPIHQAQNGQKGPESQRKREQDEASARLSQPRHKYSAITSKENIPKLPMSPTKKKPSYKEQQEASERLATPKQRVTNILPKEKQSKTSRSQMSNNHYNEYYMSSSRRRNMPPYMESKEIQKAPPEFVEMFGVKAAKKDAEQKKRDAASYIAFKHREKNSTLTAEQIATLADGILEGRRKCSDDPATIADVINELTNRRIQAMRECDYLKAMKFKEAADKVRTQFRTTDRENFYREYIRDIKDKLKEAKDALKETEQIWKDRIKQFKQSCKDEVEYVEKKQSEEMDDFEAYWRSDDAARRFSKKSPVLLSQLTMEKNLALTGDLMGAHRMQRTIKRSEQAEAIQKAAEMKQTFQVEQKNLMNKHDTEMEHLEMAHELALQTIQKQANDEISVAQKRVGIYEQMLEDESNMDKFCAKKFKKDSKVLVPMCVTINGGDDIPTSGSTRAAPRNTSVLMNYREASVSTRLQLPKLKIKRPKSSTARRSEAKGKRKKDDF